MRVLTYSSQHDYTINIYKKCEGVVIFGLLFGSTDILKKHQFYLAEVN
jgi:hypothetical protein